MPRQEVRPSIIALSQWWSDFVGMEDTPENREAIGARIRQARTAARLSRAEFARRVGVEGISAWRWETKRLAPDIWNLREVARVLHVSMEWLMSGEQPGTNAIFDAWANGRGAGAPEEAKAFLSTVPLLGWIPSELFYDLLLVAWQNGLSPEQAARAAKATIQARAGSD